MASGSVEQVVEALGVAADQLLSVDLDGLTAREVIRIGLCTLWL